MIRAPHPADADAILEARTEISHRARVDRQQNRPDFRHTDCDPKMIPRLVAGVAFHFHPNGAIHDADGLEIPVAGRQIRAQPTPRMRHGTLNKMGHASIYSRVP